MLAWAEENAKTNKFGSKEYSPFVCHIMNMFDKRREECTSECMWVSPYGWVPEAGCPTHD